MKNKFIIFAILFFSASNLFGQKDKHISFELAGSGGFASINYEKNIYQKESLKLIFRTGFSLIPFGSSNGVILIFPLMMHGIIGEKNHKLDIGIGQAPSATLPVNGIFVRMPLCFGYRYEPKDKNHYWRIAYTPLVSYLVQFQWEHWGGITYGFKLNQ